MMGSLYIVHMTKKEKAAIICDRLEERYPDARCSLTYKKPHELMIAGRLSAQSTDARVNIVTKDLFVKYPDVYGHMLKFRPILEERLLTYNEHYHWTAIHRPRNGAVFENGVPKIVVPYRTKTNAFAYNEIEWFCRSDCYVITSKNTGLQLKALLAILNSDTYFCWLYYRGKRKGEVLELFQKPLSEIPIILLVLLYLKY